MDDLVAFLRARLDEDAAEIAKHPDDHGWPADWQIVAAEESNYPGSPYLQIAKKRAEREVEAKRAILDAAVRWADPHPGVPCTNEDDPYDSCDLHVSAQKTNVNPYVLRLLALPYDSHPDYRPEWAVTP